MPKAEQLPEELRELAYRNSVELTHARWKSDVQVLAAALAPLLDETLSTHELALADSAVDSPGRAVADSAPGSTSSSGCASSAAAALDPSAMGLVSQALAAYIGPIAEVVVKRAAKRCASMPELCNLVAQEIEASGDRARFLAACGR